MAELSSAQINYWGKYICDACEKLGLRDWEIVLKVNLLDEDSDNHDEQAIARINPINGRKLAYVWLAEQFLTESARNQRHYLAHELTHCHFGAAWRQAENDLSAILGRPVETVFFNAFERNMEFGIDAVAACMAQLLPLPRGPKT